MKPSRLVILLAIPLFVLSIQAEPTYHQSFFKQVQASFDPIPQSRIREEVINHIYIPCSRLANEMTADVDVNYQGTRDIAERVFKKEIDKQTRYLFLKSMEMEMPLPVRRAMYTSLRKSCEKSVVEHTRGDALLTGQDRKEGNKQSSATDHAGWLRFNSQKYGELIIDSARGLDLSDEQLIERIIHYVKEFHSFEERHPIGFKCGVVYDFKYKKIPVAEVIGARRVPKVRMYCKGGCYDHWKHEKWEYGVRKMYYHFDECRGDF